MLRQPRGEDFLAEKTVNIFPLWMEEDIEQLSQSELRTSKCDA